MNNKNNGNPWVVIGACLLGLQLLKTCSTTNTNQQPVIIAPQQRPIYVVPAEGNTQAQPGGQTCNAFGCGANPNAFGSSPYGECNAFGCPGPKQENTY